MANQRDHNQEDMRFRVLRLLQENPDVTQRDIASTLGISLGSTNYCLRALVNKGLVKIQNFQRSKTKMGYIYLLTPQGIAAKSALTANFLRRKRQEYERLKAEIEALASEFNTTTVPNQICEKGGRHD